MSPFNIFSRHPRGDISAHADGELAPTRRDAFEAHLAGCERCRAELGELLAVRSALRDLPEASAPRSFALTPAMAERGPRPVASHATPSFVAMRVAGAGFAAVLAVVVMLDAGGIVDDSGGARSDEASTALSEADQTNRDIDVTTGAGEQGLHPAPDSSDGEIGGAPAMDDDGAVPAAGGGVGGIGGPYGSEDDRGDVEPASAPLPDDAGQDAEDTNNLNYNAGDDGSAAVPESGDSAPAALTSEDDGTSLLRVIEIGLAAMAALAIGGSFVMRRRAESE